LLLWAHGGTAGPHVNALHFFWGLGSFLSPFLLGLLLAAGGVYSDAFAFLAIFMYGLSMVLFLYVLQHLPVTVASASLYLVPVFGILIAAIILGERLTPVAIAGTAVVLLSTIIIMKWDKSAV